MISNEKLAEIMNGIENKVRHAYNCGWNDGFGAMREKVAKDIQERIGGAVEKALEQESRDDSHECYKCIHKFNKLKGYPCNMCSRDYDDHWEAE